MARNFGRREKPSPLGICTSKNTISGRKSVQGRSGRGTIGFPDNLDISMTSQQRPQEFPRGSFIVNNQRAQYRPHFAC
jgi:hypothetical protein